MSTEAIAVVFERPAAVPYYRQVPDEPIPSGSVAIKKAEFLKPATVLTLLNHIARTKPRSVVVVSHGSGSGIGLTLVPKTENALVSPYLGYLVDSRGRIDDELATELEIPLPMLRALQEAAQKVRALRLDRVDFRACTLGEFTDTLELLRAFFGASAVSAPKAFDSFGHVSTGTPTSDAKVWKDWQQKHPSATIEGLAPGRVGFEWEWMSDTTAMLVESKKALRAWVDFHMPRNKYKSGRLYFHGIVESEKVVFPGDATYRDLLGRSP